MKNTTGGLVILKGNLAPEGCVLKVAGHNRLQHRGPARVFDSEQAALTAVLANEIRPDDVVVIRYEGPAGSPGMPGTAPHRPTPRKRFNVTIYSRCDMVENVVEGTTEEMPCPQFRNSSASPS